MQGNKVKTIGRRLASLTVLLLTALCAVGALSIWNSQSLGQKLEFATEVEIPAIRQATLVDMQHDAIRANVLHAIVISGTKNKEEIQEVREDTENSIKEITEHLNAIAALPIEADVLEDIKSARPVVEEYVQAARTTVDAALNGHTEVAMT